MCGSVTVYTKHPSVMFPSYKMNNSQFVLKHTFIVSIYMLTNYFSFV